MSFILLLFAHLVADFYLQSREMGKKKSYEIKWLIGHLSIIFGVLLFPSFILFCDVPTALGFVLVNVGVHGLIDWNIWRGYKYSVVRRFPMYHPGQVKEQLKSGIIAPEFRFWDDEAFYSTIGLDQFLHCSIMFISWKLLI